MLRRHRPRRLLMALLGSALALLGTAGAASAQTTLGELAPGTDPPTYCQNGPFDGAPTGSAASLYTVPRAGVITSWSTNAAAGTGQQLTFKVYRRLGPESWLVVGHDGPHTLTPGTVDTFPTDIPVQAGDLIGNVDVEASVVPTACLWVTGNPSDTGWIAEGDAADGATITELSEEEEGVRYNETATLLSAPTISSVTPGSGPAAGGTPIAIGGTEFAEVKTVTVGSTPVPFNVASETSITATVPAGTPGATVPVTVTTAAGGASSSFAYAAAPPAPVVTPAPVVAPAPSCEVPKLKGKKLKAAKKALKKADCKLGKVSKKKEITAKKGKVVGQKPGPGGKRAAGSKVSVKLG